MDRWALRVGLSVVNQPGTLARLSRLFSDRGINLGDILAVVGSDLLQLADGQEPIILLTCRCGARLLRLLQRRIGRMPEVASVAVLRRAPDDCRPIWALLEAPWEHGVEPWHGTQAE